MIAPMKLRYTSGTVNETFTYTKGTGTFNDAIRFGLPTIVPVDYNIAAEFAPCFLTYRDQYTLSDILIGLIENPDKLQNVRKNTLNVMKNYSLIATQDRFKKILTNILSEQ